ncbi:MAG: serine/threonine-protein kinase [Ktedonobacterales bacterium]
MSGARTPPRKPAANGEHPKFWRWKAGELIDNRWYVHRALPPSRMSTVYFCLDTQTRRPMVVKTLHPELLRDTAAAERFVEECKLWIRLGEHPNIVRAFFVERLYDHPFVFVEWVYGKSLYDAALDSWIGTPALTVDRAVDVTRQICDAMLHAARVLGENDQPLIHRDIKPSNVLVTSEWRAKLTDFGIAKARLVSWSKREAPGARGGQSVFLGTPAYMSPEAFTQPQSIDVRSDVYSLGCTIFEMVVGRPAFEGNTWEALEEAHLHRPAPRLRGYRRDASAHLDELVASCLAKEPSARPQGFAEVRAALLE